MAFSRFSQHRLIQNFRRPIKVELFKNGIKLFFYYEYTTNL